MGFNKKKSGKDKRGSGVGHSGGGGGGGGGKGWKNNKSHRAEPEVDKKKKKPQKNKLVIVFDEDERNSFVGGFHKRKVERREYAEKMSEKKAREDKIAERAQKREEMRLMHEQKIAELRERMGGKKNELVIGSSVVQILDGNDDDEEDEIMDGPSKLALHRRPAASAEQPQKKKAKKKKVRTETIVDGEKLVTVTVAGMEDYDDSD